MLVEDKRPGGLAVLNGKGCESRFLRVKFDHALQVNVADHVDVMQNERLRISAKEPAGFLQSAAGIEQNVFSRDLDMHAEIMVGLQVLDHHVRKVMDIDNDVSNSESAQSRERDLEQRLAGYLHKRLRPMIGERPQASTQTCSEDHRLHLL